MQDLPSPAFSLLITNTAVVMLWDTAVMLRVVVGDRGAATQAGEVLVCTNVPTHVVRIWTLHVVVTDDLILGIGCVGGTVLGTLVITCL